MGSGPRRATAVLVAVPVLLAAAFWLLTRPAGLRQADLPTWSPDLANGERLFHAGGCASCHEENLAGGLEMKTAFGTFRVPNISPDPATGIGAWSYLEFANAMKRGIAPDGRHYYPAFPYASYARMQLEDLVDLKSWLDTFEPIANEVAVHDLKFPWSFRRGIGLWKLRYLDDGPVVAFEAPTDTLERGRYLVEAVGHCGECHTPRDRFGGPLIERWLGGAPALEDEGKVPNITPHDDGLAEWSEKDIAYYLKSGFTPDFDTVGGGMVEVQENLARLPDADRAAIAAYLKSVPPIERVSREEE